MVLALWSQVIQDLSPQPDVASRLLERDSLDGKAHSEMLSSSRNSDFSSTFFEWESWSVVFPLVDPGC